MGDTEKKLAEWAKRRGIDWRMARREITDADIGEYARFLRYAREQRAPEEAECVVLCLRLAEQRARAALEAQAARVGALTAGILAEAA